MNFWVERKGNAPEYSAITALGVIIAVGALMYLGSKIAAVFTAIGSKL